MPVDVQCPGACARADPRTVHDTKDRMRHRRRRSSSAQHQRWIRRRHARPWRVRARSATADLRSTTGDAPDRPDRSQNRAVTATERHGSQPPRTTRIHTGQNSQGKTRITRINKPRINADKHGWHLSTYPWGVSDFLCAGRVKSNAGGRCGKPRSVRFSKWLWTRSWRP